jgi:hypothetical protein
MFPNTLTAHPFSDAQNHHLGCLDKRCRGLAGFELHLTRGSGSDDVQGTFGIAMPIADTNLLGETISGTIRFNIVYFGSSGPRSNSTQHSFRTATTTA